MHQQAFVTYGNFPVLTCARVCALFLAIVVYMDFAKIQHGDFFINKIFIQFYLCVCCLRRGRGRGREGVKQISRKRENEKERKGGEKENEMRITKQVLKHIQIIFLYHKTKFFCSIKFEFINCFLVEIDLCLFVYFVCLASLLKMIKTLIAWNIMKFC